MIYQEQVMQIAQELSGYSLGCADLLRRAMGKKIKSEMDQQRASFIAGAVARGFRGQGRPDLRAGLRSSPAMASTNLTPPPTR